MDQHTTIHWQHQVDHGVARPPIVGAATVVVIDRNWEAHESIVGPEYQNLGPDTLYALDLDSGTLKWKVSEIDNGADSWYVDLQSISANYYTFTGQSDGNPERRLKVIQLDSGQEVFQLQLGTFETLSELAVSDTIVFFNKTGVVQAHSLVSGQPLWSDPPSSGRWRGGLAYDPASDSLIMTHAEATKRNPMNGNIIQSVPFEAVGFTTADIILWGTEQELQLFDWHGTLLSSHAVAFDKPLWPPAVDKDKLYILDQNFKLHELSIRAGQMTTWSLTNDGAEPITPATILNQRVYWLASDGTLRSLNPADGNETILLKSNVLRYEGNIPGGFLEHYWPGVTAYPEGLLVAFGCRTVIAVQP